MTQTKIPQCDWPAENINLRDMMMTVVVVVVMMILR